MYFHHNNHVAWLSIAKNACRSWEKVFDDLGWQKQDLYRPQVDITQLQFFGLLRWPSVRHTMGVIEYLEHTGQRAVLHMPQVNQLLVSGVFDQHSYTVSHMIPQDICSRTTFFIIDQTYYNYEQLVRNYLHSHGVDITIPVPRITGGTTTTLKDRQALMGLKQQYPDCYHRLQKNFLDADIQLYADHLARQHLWHRPGDVRPAAVELSDYYPWLLQDPERS